MVASAPSIFKAIFPEAEAFLYDMAYFFCGQQAYGPLVMDCRVGPHQPSPAERCSPQSTKSGAEPLLLLQETPEKTRPCFGCEPRPEPNRIETDRTKVLPETTRTPKAMMECLRRGPAAIRCPRPPPPGVWLASWSVVFLLLPGFSNLLYVGSHGFLRSSCTTVAEWAWIGAFSLLVLLPHALAEQRARNRRSERRESDGDGPLEREGILREGPGTGPSLAAGRSLLDWLWFSSALLSPCLWRGPGAVSKYWDTSGSGGDRGDDEPHKRLLVLADVLGYLGGKAAWPAMWNLAVVLLPVQRAHRLVEYYCCSGPGGLSTRTHLAGLHTGASTSIAAWLAAHALLLSAAYAVRARGSLRTLAWEFLPLTPFYTEGAVNGAGWAASLCLLGLWATSLPAVRRRSYERWFKMGHAGCALGFVLWSNLHDYNTLLFAWPGLLSFLVDRLLRSFALRHPVVLQGAEARGNTRVVRFTIRPPPSWFEEGRLFPGSHLYLRDRDISPGEWHPFTVSAIDHRRRIISVHAKELGDWTAGLVDKWGSIAAGNENHNENGGERNGTASFTAGLEMEGPYGPDLGPPKDPLKRPCRYVFVAGGVGLTGVSEAIQACAEEGIPLAVLWLVRTGDEAGALGADLLWNQRFRASWAGMPAGTSPPFRVFVTGDDDGESGLSGFDAWSLDDEEAPEIQGDSGAASGRSLSAVLVTVVAAGSMAVAFLVARQLCCYRSDPSSRGRTCGPACDTNATPCRVCDTREEISAGSSGEGAPCCGILVCHLCFRGLPVLLVVLLAPLLARAFLGLLAERDRWCSRWFLRRVRYRSLREVAAGASADHGGEPHSGSTPTAASHREPPAGHRTPGGPPLSELASVRFGRPPDLASALAEAICDAGEGGSRGDGPRALLTRVMVCGPTNLVRAVRESLARTSHGGRGGHRSVLAPANENEIDLVVV